MDTWQDELLDALGVDHESAEFQHAQQDAHCFHELMLSLRHYREQAGLTQSEVAEAMQTTQSRVSNLERLGGDPRISTLQRYARAVGSRIWFQTVVPPQDWRSVSSTVEPKPRTPQPSTDWKPVRRVSVA